MIPLVQDQEQSIVLNDISSQQNQMQIQMTGKVFDILSSSLYSNKVRAVIRELSTNAWDAHQEAGTQHIPFDIELPTVFNSKFRIRDYGTGMSEKTVFETYNCLFASTKSDNNDVTGMLGLGSKTPFAYTDQLTVTSYQNGKKTVYNSLKTDGGIPMMQKVLELPTDERNGLEIEFSVKKEDRDLFINEARKVFIVFRRGAKPNFLNTNLNADALRDKLVEVADGVYDLKDREYVPNYSFDAYVIQGNVAYPLEMSYAPNTLKDVVRVFGGKAIFFEVPIGTVAFTPSRESLEANKSNYLRLEPHFTDLMAKLKDNFRKEYAHIKDRLDAALHLVSNNDSFGGHFFDDIMIERGIDAGALMTQKSPLYELKDEAAAVSVYSTRARFGRYPLMREWNSQLVINKLRFFVREKVHVFLVDEKKAFKARIKAYLGTGKHNYIVCRNPAEVTKEFLDWVQRLPNVTLMKVSDLPEYKRKTSSTKARQKYRWFNKPYASMSSKDLQTLEDLGVDTSKPFYVVQNHGGVVHNFTYEGRDSECVRYRGLLVREGLICDSNPIVAIACSRGIEKVLEVFPTAKPLYDAVTEGFLAKHSKKDVMEHAKASEFLYTTNFWSFLYSVFNNLTDSQILEYSLGEEFLEIRKYDGPKYNLVDRLRKVINFQALYGDDFPDYSKSLRYALHKKIKDEFPALEAFRYHNNAKPKVAKNLQKMLKK